MVKLVPLWLLVLRALAWGQDSNPTVVVLDGARRPVEVQLVGQKIDRSTDPPQLKISTGGGSGTINPATTNQFPYYCTGSPPALCGTTISYLTDSTHAGTANQIPIAPVLLSATSHITNNSGSLGISCDTVGGLLAYCVAEGLDQILILNLSNQSAISASIGITDGVNLENPVSIKVRGKYAYVAEQPFTVGRPFFTKWDISNSAAITFVAGIPMTGANEGPQGFDIVGAYAYLADQANPTKLYTVDIGPMQLVSTYTAPDNAFAGLPNSVKAYGPYFYSLSQQGLFRVYDISKPPAVTLVGGVSLNGVPLKSFHEIAVAPPYVFVTDTSGAFPNWTWYFTTVDVSTPTAPVAANTLTLDGTNPADNILLGGPYAYLTGGPGASWPYIRVLDISNPLSPTILISITDSTSTSVEGMALIGDMLLAGDEDGVSFDRFILYNLSGYTLPTTRIGAIRTSRILNDGDEEVAGSLNVNTAIHAGNGFKTDGGTQSGSYATVTNCASSASPAVCGSAAAGRAVIAAAATTVVVNTTAVTANSEIKATRDDSLGTALSVTCNTQGSLVVGTPRVTARVAGTSFTVAVDVAPTANPLCFNYLIVN